MTREEAIKIIDCYDIGFYDLSGEKIPADKLANAFDLAIEALSAEAEGEWIEKYNGNGWNDFWDYTCSNCGKKYERADAVLYHANYCPNCGARMKGGAE